jgi:filamin
VSFTPRIVGEHRISVSHRNLPVLGSPFSCKVYDVTAIKVKDTKKGVIGLPVTFLGKKPAAISSLKAQPP